MNLRMLTKAVAGLAMIGAASLSLSASTTAFYEDFSSPPGADWAEVTYENGLWTHNASTGRMEASGLAPTAPHTKLLVYQGMQLDQDRFAASIDFFGTSYRWAGLAFHVQPDSPQSFYSAFARFARVGDTQPASQIHFRRYDDGALTLLTDVNGEGYVLNLSEDLMHQLPYRFTVVSETPGTYTFIVYKLDPDTREELAELGRMTVTDAHLPVKYRGGYAALHADSERVSFDDFFLAKHAASPQEAPRLDVAEAHEVEFASDPGRLYQLQVLNAGEWSDHGNSILGTGSILRLQAPLHAGTAVRLLSSSQ